MMEVGNSSRTDGHTVLVAMSVDLVGTSASNDTVRRIHDDKVALSNKCVLPMELKWMFEKKM